jgi:septum formation protein
MLLQDKNKVYSNTANMVTLIGLVSMGRKFAFKVAIGRVILSSILLGTFLTPTFYLSFSGALVACVSMILIYRPLGKISLVGVSVVGAIMHNMTQLTLAYLILIKHGGILFMFPLLIISAVIAGIINGYLAFKIIPRIAEFADRKIFLASGSQRRITILKKAGLPVIVVLPAVEEDRPGENEDPLEFSMRQARKKLESVTGKLLPPGCVISSDTIVEIDGKIFIKPEDTEDAGNMLKTLSDKEQRVYTAVVIKNLKTGRKFEKVEITTLKMKKFTEEEIEEFKGKHLDKAGGYAIQGMSDKYIQWIKGSYTNVVGFPVEVVRGFLKNIWK